MSSSHLAQYLQELYSTSNTLNCDRSIDEICHIFIIAEALLDPETRNRAVRSLYNAMREEIPDPSRSHMYRYPTIQLVSLIYSRTASSANQMRRLLVDVFYDVASKEWFNDYDSAPKEFLWDLQMNRFEQRKKKVEPLEYDLGQYLELTEAEMAEQQKATKERSVDATSRMRGERKSPGHVWIVREI